jgi:hypothetical protein
MSTKSYFKVTGTVFLIVAAVHLSRVLKGWDVNIHTLDLPMWVSWAGFLLAGCLAYQGLSKK